MTVDAPNVHILPVEDAAVMRRIEVKTLLDIDQVLNEDQLAVLADGETVPTL